MAEIGVRADGMSPVPLLAKWLAIGLVLLVLVYNVVVLLMLARFPTDGCGLHLERSGLLVSGRSCGDGLQPGDLIVAVNGRSVTDGVERPGVWSRFLWPSVEVQGADYTIVRAGVHEQRWVPWRSLTFGAALGNLWPLFLIGLAFLGSVVLTLRDQSRNFLTRLLALAFCLEGLNLANDAWTLSGTGGLLATAWFFHPLDLISFSLTNATALYGVIAVSNGFREHPRRRRLAGGALYGLNLLLILIGILGGLQPDRLLEVRHAIYRVFFPLVTVELGLVFVGLIRIYRTVVFPGARNQIRWLVWGAGIGLMPWFLLNNLPQTLGVAPLVSFKVTVLALAVVPFAFYFSVTRRGLSLTDSVVYYTLIYGGAATLVTLLTVAVVFAITGLGPYVDWLDYRLVRLLALLLIVIAAEPVRHLWRRAVEWLCYRYRLEFDRLLQEIGDRLSTTLQLEPLGQMLLEEIPQRLQIERAMVLLRQDDRSLVSMGRETRYFAAGSPLARLLERHTAPLVVSQEHAALESIRLLRMEGWELILPLFSGQRWVGDYFLGLRINGDLYSWYELGKLRRLAQQIAAALENARLYSQVEHYSQSLESLVQDRTAELALVNCNLARERDRLNVILQNMADGLMVTSPTGQIVLVNPALEGMLHVGSRRLVGQPLNLVPQLDTLTNMLMVAYNQSGQVINQDFPLGNRVLQASTSALGDRSAIITVLRDVTREKEVDRMKTEFVSTVSHELRTPLTSVLGFAKLISKTVEKDLVPRIRLEDEGGQRAVVRIKENLGIIVSEGERLTRLINDVLDIAKMEAGRVDWHDGPCDLLEIVGRAVQGVHSLATWRGLEVRLEAEESFRLVADPDRLLQVITNLLSNAIKFTERGEIRVRLRRVEPDEVLNGWHVPEGESGGVVVSVQDSGMGIPAESLSRLFQRFQQVGDTLRDKPRGTGLGLAISREIVGHYGGTIWAESEVGVGSTFSFVLPLPRLGVEAPGFDPQPPADVSSTGVTERPRTVLVVDDDPLVRQLLGQALIRGGYQVLQAVDGMSAITEARRYRPSLMILDVKMPGLSGLDVMQVLKADPETAGIPILILSANDRQRSLELGAAAHLTKPVGLETLLKTVETLLADGN